MINVRNGPEKGEVNSGRNSRRRRRQGIRHRAAAAKDRYIRQLINAFGIRTDDLDMLNGLRNQGRRRGIDFRDMTTDFSAAYPVITGL